MIDSKDLRLNNWVEHYSGKYIRVNQLQFIKDEGYYINELSVTAWEAIPLTPKLLTENCGFELISKIYPTYRHPGFKSFIIEEKVLNDGYNFRQRINKEESLFMREIKYLHQLQTLFYALCGQELEIKF